jgi:hypothetical protein
MYRREEFLFLFGLICCQVLRPSPPGADDLRAGTEILSAWSSDLSRQVCIKEPSFFYFNDYCVAPEYVVIVKV